MYNLVSISKIQILGYVYIKLHILFYTYQIIHNLAEFVAEGRAVGSSIQKIILIFP